MCVKETRGIMGVVKVYFSSKFKFKTSFFLIIYLICFVSLRGKGLSIFLTRVIKTLPVIKTAMYEGDIHILRQELYSSNCSYIQSSLKKNRSIEGFFCRQISDLLMFHQYVYIILIMLINIARYFE